MINLKNAAFTLDYLNGCGGDIAKKLAEALGLPFFGPDAQITQAAVVGNIDERLMRKYAEKQVRAVYDLAAEDYGHIKMPAAGVFSAAKSQAVLDLARGGSCVFAGGHASSVYADSTDAVRIFIHAKPEKWIHELASTGLYGKLTLEQLVKEDERRRSYYRSINKSWGMAEFYSLVIDVTDIDEAEAAKSIYDFFFQPDGDMQKESA